MISEKILPNIGLKVDTSDFFAHLDYILLQAKDGTVQHLNNSNKPIGQAISLSLECALDNNLSRSK